MGAFDIAEAGTANEVHGGDDVMNMGIDQAGKKEAAARIDLQIGGPRGTLVGDLHDAVVLHRHVLRAGLIPVITMMGLQFSFMMGGAVVVENIFAWNGVGRMAVEAIFQRDYPVIQGFILTFAVVVVSVSILIDAVYALVDPRIRRS